MPYVEASAKENINVEQAFFSLTQLLYKWVNTNSLNDVVVFQLSYLSKIILFAL